LGAALLELVASADFANAKAAGVEMVRMLGGEYLAEISCGALEHLHGLSSDFGGCCSMS
jgi:hypothetical protein